MSTPIKSRPTTVGELRRMLSDAPSDMPIVFAFGAARNTGSAEIQTPRVLSEQSVGYNGNSEHPEVVPPLGGFEYSPEEAGQPMLVLSALPFKDQAESGDIHLEIDRTDLTT